ncbi:MAG: O-antigen ligase family protein [Holophagales bacterium]|nr:O-antigen ligase family protein [Holophagales bacterium]
MLLSMKLFGMMLAAGAVFVLFLPIWWIIPLDLMSARFFGNWSIGFLRIGPNDLMVGFIGAAILLRGRRSEEWRVGKLPLIVPWTMLMVLLCLSYLNAPINQENLTAPHRIAYQLARYCVRPVIYMPIALVLIRSARRTYLIQYFIILAAVFCSLPAIQQGYAGMAAAPGPFRTGNQLGGVLVMPMLMALAGMILPRNRFHFGFSVITMGLMARALLFSQSRGAMVACVGGGLVFGGLLLSRDLGRRRLQWMSPLVGIGLILAVPALPFVLQNTFVQHFLSAADGRKASTMQWRMEERWPHFWGIAVDNPLFGVGTAVDLSLGPKANTPHNGFLSLLVMWGFPAFLLLLFFAFRTIYTGCRLFWSARNPDHRVFGLTVAASLSGILTHQLVEVTINAPFTFKVFWILVATTELARRWPDDDDEAPAYFPSFRELHGLDPIPLHGVDEPAVDPPDDGLEGRPAARHGARSGSPWSGGHGAVDVRAGAR